MPLIEENPIVSTSNPILPINEVVVENDNEEVVVENDDEEVIWDKGSLLDSGVSLVPKSKTKGLGPLNFISGIADRSLQIGKFISELDWSESDLNPTKEGLTSKDLYKPENFEVIQNMMKRRYGMDLKYDTQEKIVKSWRQMMKNRDMYNSVNAVTMWSWLKKANPEEQKAAKDSILLWKEVGGAFQKEERKIASEVGFVLNDKGQLDYEYYKDKDASELFSTNIGRQSILDTTQAIVTDPVNIIPIITFGRIKTKVARKVADKIKDKEINILIAKINKNKKMTPEKKANEIQKEINRLTFTTMQKASIQFKAMKVALLGSAGINGMFNASLDYFNQESDIMADVKKDYSVGQTLTIATTASILGGGLNFGYHALFNTAARNALKGIDPTPWIFEKMVQNRALVKGSAKTSNAKDVWKLYRPEKASSLAEALKANTKKFTTWLEKTEKGAPLRYSDKGVAIDNDKTVYRSFILGVPEEGIEGLDGLLRRYGINYEGKRTYLKDKNGNSIVDNVTNWYVDVALSAPKEIKKEMREFYRSTLGLNGPVKFRDPKTNRPVSFDDAMFIIAADTRDAGSILQIPAQLAKDAKKRRIDLNAASKIEQTILDPIDPKSLRGKLNAIGEKISSSGGIYDSSLWVTKSFIRAIVVNPGTTWLNYKGWQIMTGLESTGRMAQMMLHGGNSTIQSLIGNGKYSARQWQMTQNIMDNQTYKVKKLLDLETTVEEAQSFMAFYPEAQKLMKWANGGVEVKDMNKYLGLAPTEPTKTAFYKGPAKWMDTYIDKAQILWGTKAMDIYSKSVEFMTHIDYLTRKNYGVGIDEFLDNPNAWRVTETDFWTGMIADSVANAQKNTLSKPFKEMKGGWGKYLGIIEDLRNIPLIGTKVPFGQFFNNTIAFQVEASGISALHRAFRSSSKIYDRKEKQGQGRTVAELTGFAAASYTALFFMAESRRDALEEGLPWYTERDDSGRLKNYRYDYPRNLPMWLGTVGAYYARGELPPADLIIDGGKTFTYQAFTRGATLSLDILKDLFLDTLSSNQSKPWEIELLIKAGEFSAGIGAGFMRPIEQVGDFVKTERGDIVVDKRINSKNINKLLTYTSSVFDYLNENMGVPLPILSLDNQTEKFDATSERPLTPQLSKILGVREEVPISSTQRMMNQISKPYFLAGVSVRNIFPEINNIMTRNISYHLEWNAEKWINSDAWTKGNPKSDSSLTEQRQLIWKEKVLAPAKESALLQLKSSLDPNDIKLAILYDISKKGSEVRLQKILQDYEGNKGRYGNRKLIDLDTAELETFYAYTQSYDAMKLREIEEGAPELATPRGTLGGITKQ